MADSERPPSPLAALQGKPVPGPAWFASALEQPCDTGTAGRLGTALSWKAWGTHGAPGLILVHGGTAHKGWWDAIGPFLAQEGYRVVAPDLAGMGNSGWRDVYSMDDHAADVMVAAEAGGAFEIGKPVLAGHSFGGFVTLSSVRKPNSAKERRPGGAGACTPTRPPRWHASGFCRISRARISG